MKAVFPCKGVVVVTKQNVDIVSKVYKENLINSPLFSAYQQGNLHVQVGPFNYFPQNTKVVLRQNTELLTIQELNKALAGAIQKADTNEVSSSEKYDDTPIEDSSIMEHPFFQTLKQVD